jgi:formamidopyrimidine-DNA glycosylase
LGGRTLERVEVVDPSVVKGGADLSRLAGATVEKGWRRGKWALLDCGVKGTLALHFRMTGKVVEDGQGQRKARLRLVPQGGVPVVFEDLRRFGEVWLLQDLESFFRDKKLGPEPWPQLRDGAWWKTQLMGLRAPIKVALMRQDRVAGLGNIAGSEVCFRAGIHPATPTPEISDAEWQGIADGVRAWVEDTLNAESGDEIAYVNQGGEGSFDVYGHAGQPCPSCATPIERQVQSGRGTFFCPRCQSSRRMLTSSLGKGISISSA